MFQTTVIFAIAAVNFTTFMAPGSRNLKFALLGAAILTLGGFLFDAAGAKMGYSAWAFRSISAGWSFTIFCASVLVVVLGISLAVASVVYLVRTTLGKDPAPSYSAG